MPHGRIKQSKPIQPNFFNKIQNPKPHQLKAFPFPNYN